VHAYLSDLKREHDELGLEKAQISLKGVRKEKRAHSIISEYGNIAD
jgi:hypothetical protein